MVKDHWSIESFHWSLDRNLLLDDIKRKSPWAARNLATMQRIVHGLYYIRKGRYRKKSDKAKGVAELMRPLALSFTKLMRFLSQK